MLIGVRSGIKLEDAAIFSAPLHSKSTIKTLFQCLSVYAYFRDSFDIVLISTDDPVTNLLAAVSFRRIRVYVEREQSSTQ